MYRFSFIARLLAPIIAFLTPLAAKAQDGYERIASICSSPLFDSTEEARVGYKDTAVMLRNEMAYQALAGWVSTNPGLERVRTEVYGHLWDCNRTLAEIRRRDASVPDIQAIAVKGLRALPALDKSRRDAAGNLRPDDQKDVAELAAVAVTELGQWLWDKHQAGVERANYTGYSRKARRSARSLATVAENQCIAARSMVYGIGVVLDDTKLVGLPIREVRDSSPAKVAGLVAGDTIVAVDGGVVIEHNRQQMIAAIAGPKDTTVKITYVRNGSNRVVSIPRSMAIYEAALLSVDIDGSWNGYFESDWVYYTNISGRDLTNVTLSVQLKGRHGARGVTNGDSHLHYVAKWPAGATKIARYMSTGASGIAYDESVDQVDTLTYKLFSNEWKQQKDVQYTGKAYDEDVKRYCDDIITLKGSWHDRDGHLLLNTGLLLQNGEKGYSFPCASVSMTVSRGVLFQQTHWTMADGLFPSGTSDFLVGNSRYFSSTAFSGLGRPAVVAVVLEFPYSAYKHELTWEFSR